MTDAEDVIVATTNASLFAYVADGQGGIKVLQLTSPDNPGLYGFSPQPTPELIAWAKTPAPALSLSKGLDRDRAVDETGGRSEEHTSELQSLMRISYAVFCLKKKKNKKRGSSKTRAR